MTDKQKKEKKLTVVTVNTAGGIVLCLPFEIVNYHFINDPNHLPILFHITSLYDLEYAFECEYFTGESAIMDKISDGVNGLFMNGLDEDGNYKPYQEAGHHPIKGDFWTEIEPSSPSTQYKIRFQDGSTIWVNNDDNPATTLEGLIQDKLTLKNHRDNTKLDDYD